MSHLHYVMDLYFPDEAHADGHRREVLRIDAHDDETARVEAGRVDRWKRPEFYHLRAIRSAVRSGDKMIYDSRSAGAAPEESVITLARPEIVPPTIGGEASSPIPDGLASM